jgi:hypothetical protein
MIGARATVRPDWRGAARRSVYNFRAHLIWINVTTARLSNTGIQIGCGIQLEVSVKDKQNNLLETCASARRAGADFPTIWRDILKYNPLVVGLPIQRIDDNGPKIEVQLITGKSLMFDSNGFSLW